MYCIIEKKVIFYFLIGQKRIQFKNVAAIKCKYYKMHHPVHINNLSNSTTYVYKCRSMHY